MPLEWTESTDDGETIYEAPSRSSPDFRYPLCWTIDRDIDGKWTLVASDSELLSDDDLEREFDTLDDAKAHCERREAEFVAKAREP